MSDPGRLWRGARRTGPIVLCAWVFLSAPLVHLHTHSALAQSTVMRAVLEPIRAMGLTQNWRMFAPPGRRPSGLGVAFLFEDGWTDAVPLIDLFGSDTEQRVWSDRGESRVHTFLRASSKHDQHRDGMPPIRRLYFEALGHFFCDGQGALPGLAEARFYLLQRQIKPFYEAHESPRTASPDTRLPLYTLRCEDMS